MNLSMPPQGRPLPATKLLGICHLMLLGGLDTVTATLDCMVCTWQGTPIAGATHRTRRSIPTAIQELLRHETPVMLVPRVVKQGITMSGVELHPGDPVMLVIGAANRDEAVFEDPDSVDYGRDLNRHMAFGNGNHKCVGAHLARLELRVASRSSTGGSPTTGSPTARRSTSPPASSAHSLPLVWG